MKTARRTSPLLVTTVIVGLVLSASVVFAKDAHKPITRELIKLVESSPEIGSMLEASIAGARAANPDPATNPVQTLQEYYDFIDRAVELLPQDIVQGPVGSVRDQMLQGICYFYFLVGQPLPALEGKGLYRNTIQYYPPFSAWLRSFADAWGAYLDTEESWGDAAYQHVRNDPMFSMNKGWYESPERWKTFNQFFSRHLSSPAARPIASPEDPAVIVSPADAVPQGAWPIDGNSRIQVEGGLKVKLATYYSVKELLGEDSPYKDAFANGVLTHTFLNVNDYHRYHFAVGGTVKESEVISQNVALEVAWSKDQGKYVPLDLTGWQFTQTRGCVVVDAGEFGLVALVPMGMAQVSSVNFEKNIQVGSRHNKGDMLGYFLFGGSDFVMLFQDRSGFEITAPFEHRFVPRTGSDHVRKEATYQHILMGEEYGVMKGQAK